MIIQREVVIQKARSAINSRTKNSTCYLPKKIFYWIWNNRYDDDEIFNLYLKISRIKDRGLLRLKKKRNKIKQKSTNIPELLEKLSLESSFTQAVEPSPFQKLLQKKLERNLNNNDVLKVAPMRFAVSENEQDIIHRK